ncbi:MAG: U32 family peptidase [Oscillospiraceae bacterium]
MALELLSPAGSPEALRAAVQSGCGAVYLGWGAFNARRGAKNFTDEEFAAAIRYCHVRGVRVFLTLNTLVTDRELPAALDAARTACRLGVDSVLVQDWGLFSLLRETLPDLPLHASTQMSLFTSGGANEVYHDGCERVVLARECSREDIAAVCRACPAEVEIFGHGALCMCYSGQCAFSALIGGRSGNRGTCAQPCRLPYGFNAPAKNTYPLSLKDSCLASRLEDMADMGVSCVKLEGRMKRPEYVAVVTDIYARLIRERRRPTPAETQALELAFSRSGFTEDYWLGRHGPAMFGIRPENTPEPKELFAAARARCEKDDARTVPIHFSCILAAETPASLTVSDGDGHTVTVSGPTPELAQNKALTAAEVSARLQKTGGTAFRCADCAAQVAGGLFLSAGALNALRRDALSALEEARCAVPHRRELPVPPLPDLDCAAPSPALTVSVASWAQAEALLPLSPARLCVPLEILAEQTALPAFSGEWCAIFPRVWRDSDEPQLRAWLAHAKAMGVTAALSGNLGHLPLLRDSGLTVSGDFGLNVFNSRALDYLRRKILPPPACPLSCASPKCGICRR